MMVPRFLTFHGIGEPRRTLEPGEAPLWVSELGFDQIVAAVKTRPDVHLTFDDGNASDHDIALGCLARHEVRATFFVLAGRLDQPGSLSRSQLLELASEGMTVGSHGMDHIPWRSLPPQARDRELVHARAILEDVIQRPIDQAALPLGRYDAGTLREVTLAGYQRVFTSDGYWRDGTSLLVPRATIRGLDTVQDVRRLVDSPPSPIHRLVGRAKQFVKARR